VRIHPGPIGQLSVVEFRAPSGFAPPLHRHNTEDELFIVMDGTIRVFHGDQQIDAPRGSMALLRRGIPHSFLVVSETAHIVNVTGAEAGSPRFDQMVSALGVPTRSHEIPDPSEIDPDRVAEVCASFDIDIVGPPPG